MDRFKGQVGNLVLCTLGLIFDWVAISRTFVNLSGETLYVLLGFQVLVGLYLVYAATVTLHVIWVEWRWQPAKFR